MIDVVCQYGPLRDEEFGSRPRAAGARVGSRRVRGLVHSSLYTPLPTAVRYCARTTAMLAAAHGLRSAG